MDRPPILSKPEDGFVDGAGAGTGSRISGLYGQDTTRF